MTNNTSTEPTEALSAASLPHPCEIIFAAAPNPPAEGTTSGTCRITGKPATGVPFNKWVRKTFTDFHWLKPGEIISNEALLCFLELSPYIQNLLQRDKPQTFRTYSHFVKDGVWQMFTKGQKAEMLPLMLSIPEVCVISESGQKHLVFKHRPNTWMLEETTIFPDVARFQFLHSRIYELCREFFAMDEVATGAYNAPRIQKFGIARWRRFEDDIKPHRGGPLFDLAIFFAKTEPLPDYILSPSYGF